MSSDDRAGLVEAETRAAREQARGIAMPEIAQKIYPDLAIGEICLIDGLRIETRQGVEQLAVDRLDRL